jgi:hypothetical protein
LILRKNGFLPKYLGSITFWQFFAQKNLQNKNGWLGLGATTLFLIVYYLLDGGMDCIKMT